MAKKPEKTDKKLPIRITYGSAVVTIMQRTNGLFALSWRELGQRKRTTITNLDHAVEWARQKARDIEGAVGRRWVSPAEADVLVEFRRICGPIDGSMARVLADLKVAMGILGGHGSLAEACQWYADNGPLRIERTTVADTIRRFLAEYETAPDPTRRTFGTELEAFVRANPRMGMMDLTQSVLEAWTGRRLEDGSPPSARTQLNRITTWVTLLNRARDWNLLPPGKHAAALLRRPTIPDTGREILSIAQGRALIAAVEEKDPRLMPYLLIAGWLGLRPSECQRLTWDRFDWERGYLHVCVNTAKKTSTERYVPIHPALAARLRPLQPEEMHKRTMGRCCIFRSREYLSVLARTAGIVETWVPDVLRHSYCSYRLAATGAIERVAEEAGNSPAIIRSNYRRPVIPEDGAAWWGLLSEGLIEI